MTPTITIFQPLSDAELSEIAQIISTDKMEIIAVQYFGFKQSSIDNIQGNAYQRNFQLLINWRNMNSATSRQVK